MPRPANLALPAVLAAAVVGLVAAAGHAQDFGPETKYWPLAKINFPIDVAKVSTLNPKPVALRFYAAAPKAAFQQVAEKKLDELDEIVEPNKPTAAPKRGFVYTSKADGPVEFALQYVFADGTVSPSGTALAAQYKIVFDTEPPKVDAQAVGGNGVRWTASDPNLVSASVRLEGHYVGEADWRVMTITRDLQPEDRYEWNVPEGKTLEVRVLAKDRAGHSGHSGAVKLGGGKWAGGAVDPLIGKGGGASSAGFGNPLDAVTGTKIDYANTTKLTVRSKITHVTRSGVKSVLLFVSENGGEWKPAEKKDKAPVDIKYGAADTAVEMEYDAKKDGEYGFVVLPVSGADTRPDDPRPNEPPQYRVVVDTTHPEVALKSARAVPGGLNGPQVEIEWSAYDKYIRPDPITLEFSDDGKAWKPIATKIPNTGKYTWEVTDKALWKVWVRVTCDDLAGNSSLAETKPETPVLIDLDRPAGTIEKVNPNGPPPPPKTSKKEPVGAEPEPRIVPTGLPTEPKRDEPKKPDPPKVDSLPAPPITAPPLTVQPVKVEPPKVDLPKVEPMPVLPPPAASTKPDVPKPAVTPVLPPPAASGALPIPSLPPEEPKKK